MATKKEKEYMEELQNKVRELEASKQFNTYEEVFQAFVDGFVLQQVNSSIKTIEIKKLQEWFSNPDDHMEDISNLLTYYYITDGDIFQLYDLIFSLPKLEYKIEPYTITKTYEKDVLKIRQALEKKVNYKRLTRDLLVQEAHDGTVIGTWLGTSSSPYFYVFNDLKHVFPYGEYKGTMRAVFDLSYLDTIQEAERNALYENLKPLVTKSKYEKWKNASDKDKKNELRYVLLPKDKTLVARGHTLYRNQRLGIPYGTASLLDMNHKQKMKDLERSIADKVIRAVAVLKFQGKDSKDTIVGEKAQKKVFESVKKAMNQATTSKNGSITLIGLPEWATFEDSKLIDGADEILDSKKYDGVNRDVSVGNGINDVLIGGSNGNYASAKLNLEIIYQKIAVMLEEIEEIFNQLIVIILGESKGMNYTFRFVKDMPISKKEKIDYLVGLASTGHSIKYVLDELGIDFHAYIKQSQYEIETLKLREKIIPPLSTYTSTADDVGGRPSNSDDTNDSTISNKETGGDNSPKADV